ncbi:MAG: signal peptidase II [Aquificaceae bacterium]
MGRSLRRYALVYTLFALLVLTLDLTSKSLVEAYLSDIEISLLPFLHLVLVYNKGIAFGLFADAPAIIRIPLLFIAPVIALVITFIFSLRSRDYFKSLLMGMVGGGAMGNLYDRALLGHVRDFIYLSYGGLSWPAFNVADASISLALLLFLIRGIRTGKS